MDEIQKQILELTKRANVPNPIHYVDYAVEELAMQTLNKYIKSCDYCEECAGGTKSLVAGNPHAAIMIIGEYVLPSQSEKELVNPYEGSLEGELIKMALEDLHVNPEQLLWMNVVNCYTHKMVNGKALRRAPKTSERENCQTYIDYAIDAFKPLYIILLGNIALNVFKTSVIGKERGNMFMIRDKIPTMPTYSPSTIQQMIDDEDDFAEDFYQDFCDDLKTLFTEAAKTYPDSDILISK